MTEERAEPTTELEISDRDAIRRQLEETRQAFHALLNSIDPDAWERPSGNRAWTVGQLMWHIASVVGLTVGSVAMAKQGRNYSPPRWISNRINSFTTKRGAKGATIDDVAELYDESHERLLAALDEVTPEEWHRGSRIFGRYTTVEGHFRSVAEHFAEHRADIPKMR